MNFQSTIPISKSKHSTSKSQVETASSSSDYSTCSDNPEMMNLYWSKRKLRDSIIAGHLIKRADTDIQKPNYDTLLEDTNFSVSPLDLNLDVLSKENDVYSDCRDNSTVCNDDSTMYLELGQVVNSKENQSDFSNINFTSSQSRYQKITATDCKTSSPVAEALQERLLTIIEEREITSTTDHIIKDLSSLNSNNHTGQLVPKMMNQFETRNEQNNNFAKKLSFFNLNNVEDNQNNNLELKKTQTLSNSHAKWPRKANDTCNHNNTESFVLWEKFCETSEKLASRRSFSFSELNSVTETCSGDDEYSTSYKSLDDISGTSVETEKCSKYHQRKSTIYRSKSCESILKEVKHLPHLLYDRFLKCLSNEITRIRKENVVCTCQKRCRKNYNENEGRNPKKPALKLTNKIVNIEIGETGSKLPLRLPSYSGAVNKRLSPVTTDKMKLSSEAVKQTRSSPTYLGAVNKRLSPKLTVSPVATNKIPLSPAANSQNRLSPDTTSKTWSHLQLSPRSPARTSKNRYFWNKEIVSPVGEYIRGKRQNPFKNSPSNKKDLF